MGSHCTAITSIKTVGSKQIEGHCKDITSIKLLTQNEEKITVTPLLQLNCWLKTMYLNITSIKLYYCLISNTNTILVLLLILFADTER